jgi:peptidyl-prolyl cis-trans isomerase D
MFDSIRKHQRILQFLLLILIFPAFVFFGVSGYDRFLSDGDSVATVGGAKITRQEFDQAMRQQLEQMRRVLGDQVDAKLLDTPSARAEVLEGLISQRLLLNAAYEQKVTISDAQLRQTILAIPGLKTPDGGFDMERYRALLSSQGMTEPVFEAQLRRDLAIQALPEAASQSVIVPRTVLEQVIRLQEQVREVRELAFKPADFAAQVKPTDEELRKHYEANAAAYETPESAKVEYLVLSAKAIAEQITLSADDVHTYYEQNKTRFTTAEERRASHILIAVDAGAGADARKAAREKAEKLLKQARDGADFAALAKANSSDSGSAAQGGDLGYFARGAMVKSFADAAFALKEGAISDVVETEFGYHIIKLTGIKPGAVRSFDEVRKEIESDLRQQQAGAKFAETADAFSNMVYEQADSLKPAADRFGLKIQTAESLTRAGTGLPKDSPLANPKLLAAVFSPESIRTKRNSEAIEVGGNTLVSARVVEYRPAKRKPFESVQAEVRANVVDAEARKLAIAAGAKRLAELRAGGAATGFSEAQGISRAAATTVPAQAVDAVFKLPTDKLPAYVGLDIGARGYSIYALVKVTDPSAEAIAQRRAAYEQQVAQAIGQQQVTDLIESLKSKAKVTRRPDNTSVKTDAP